MKGLILAGGFGTRLRPLSCTRPKLLFPIAGRTMLEWILRKVCGSEIEELILAVNYLSEILEKRVGNRISDTKITYSLESKSLGTGGPVKNAEKELQNENIVTIRIESDSWFFRLFVTYIEADYDTVNKRLVKYWGPSNLNDDKGDAQKVYIQYEY